MKIEKDENRKLNKLLRTQLATIKINFDIFLEMRITLKSQKFRISFHLCPMNVKIKIKITSFEL